MVFSSYKKRSHWAISKKKRSEAVQQRSFMSAMFSLKGKGEKVHE